MGTQHSPHLRLPNRSGATTRKQRAESHEAGKQLATNGPQRERDAYAADRGEDRHGAAGPHWRQNELEQGDRVT
jgi:hypothetical protein